MQSLVEKGRACLKAGKVQEAIDALTEALGDDPSSFEARMALGIAYGQASDFAQAREVLASAVRLNPGHAGAQYNFGLACEQSGDRTAATAAFRRALEIDPAYAAARRALGEQPASHPQAPAPVDLLCLCPQCGTPARQSQPAQTCTLCGQNLAPVFRGYVKAEQDYEGHQTLRCGNCREAISRLDGTCSRCGQDLRTGTAVAAPPAPGGPAAARSALVLSWGADSIAPLWKRWLAQYLDNFVILGITIFAVIVLINSAGSGIDILASIFVVPVAYETVMIGKWGQTLGKMRFDIQVDVVDGSDTNYLRALIRAVVKYLLLLGTAPAAAAVLPNAWHGYLRWLPSPSVLWVLTNPNRRALHDILSGTIVTGV